MPARAGASMALRSPMKGGRRTNLGGGNRGECQFGLRPLQRYGDWMRNNTAGTSNGAPPLLAHQVQIDEAVVEKPKAVA